MIVRIRSNDSGVEVIVGGSTDSFVVSKVIIVSCECGEVELRRENLEHRTIYGEYKLVIHDEVEGYAILLPADTDTIWCGGVND